MKTRRAAYRLRVAAMCSALTLSLTAFVVPVGASETATAPIEIVVYQEDFVMSADIIVGDTQTVGTVTIQVGASAPVTIAQPDALGLYSRTLSAAGIGSAVTFRATAVSMIEGVPVTSAWTSSQPVVFSRAQAPSKVKVSQDDMTLLVDVDFAESTMLGLLSMKVGTGSFVVICDAISGDNCGDGPFEVEMTAAQLGKVVIFRVVSMPMLDLIPESLPTLSDPFTFSQAVAPATVSIVQEGYNLKIAVGVATGQTIGDVVVTTLSAPEGEYVEPLDGNYVYELSPDDIGHLVRVTATANKPPLAMSVIKAATITPSIAGLPKFGAIQQWSTLASVPVTIAAGNSLVVEATVDGEPRPVSVTAGVARITLTADDADRTIVFYAHGMKGKLPNSDEVMSEEYTVVGAEMPAAVTVTHTDAIICGKARLASNQTVGSMVATVGGVNRTVVLSEGKRCITLVRSDVGKEVVFSASARRAGQVDSMKTDSDPYLVEAAAKPTVRLTQSGKVVTATIRVAAGQSIGATTYTINYGKAVTLKPVKGKYTFTVSSAVVGKKFVVKTYATQAGFFPSLLVTSTALTIKK